jgi:hypothetical protein
MACTCEKNANAAVTRLDPRYPHAFMDHNAVPNKAFAHRPGQFFIFPGKERLARENGHLAAKPAKSLRESKSVGLCPNDDEAPWRTAQRTQRGTIERPHGV